MVEETVVGDVDFGPDAARFAPDVELRGRWFGRFLSERHHVLPSDEPPLWLFLMGTGDGHRTIGGHLFHGGTWRGTDQWPLTGTRLEKYFLHPGGKLGTEPPGRDADASGFDADPGDAYPAIGGRVTSDAPPGFLPPGPRDQRCRPWIRACRGSDRPLTERADVLVFETKPLSRDLDVTGPISVRLWVASSTPDADFVGRLADVYPASPDYPEGYALLVAEGIMRMRYRDDRARAALIRPHAVYEVSIELQSTSNLFKRRHIIRLYVAGAAYPQYDVNPNTGEALGRSVDSRVARQVVFHDRSRPSHVLLPIVH
jgi:putative CocE/NonD family hydrolase